MHRKGNGKARRGSFWKVRERHNVGGSMANRRKVFGAGTGKDVSQREGRGQRDGNLEPRWLEALQLLGMTRFRVSP